MTKTLLILGANSDIAKAYAKLWTGKNPSGTLILGSRNTEELEKFVSANALHERTTITALDVCAYETHHDFYNGLPNKPSEVLYAAGVMFDNETALPNWQESASMIDVNYKGAVSLLNIIANDENNINLKRIVGISSIAGVKVRKSNFLYGATKAALSGYLFGLWQQLSKRKIIVQALTPGFVDTKMTKHLKLKASLLNTPEEIAQKLFQSKKYFYVYPNIKWLAIALILKMLPLKLLSKI